MRVLVTGAAGLLGSAILDCFRSGHDVVPAVRSAIDVTDAAAVARSVASVRPDVIINCTAYNDVDGAESHAADALAVNAFGVLALARAARETRAALVHYSTDFVFDGETSRPYVEEDAPNPRSVYGASKLLGEWFAAEVPRHYVLRVESLFGPGVRNGARRGSLDTIVHRIRRAEVVPVFVDRTASPSFTPDLARATHAILTRELPPGTYHCVNSGSGTWLDIAREAARVLGAPLQIRELTLESIDAPARRPRFCALSPARLAQFGIVMPSWQDALARHLREDPGP